MRNTGFSHHPACLDHDPGPEHPESPDRLRRTLDYLHRQPWFGTLTGITPRAAARANLEAIHSPAYLDRAGAACRNGSRHLDSMDTGICERSFDAAVLAAGAPLVLADAICAGQIGNGFALIRPPGHHAEQGMALGFCLLNNVAILARYLQHEHGFDKVLILDWDVHHGNGTQHSFETDPSVFYISTHQYPFYPGTGAASETGSGSGRGATLNCPLPAFSGDREYRQVFEDQILPAIERFQPDFIIISAGFDAHADDPLAQMQLTTGCYGWMTTQVLEAAARHCDGRIISVLEGGYSLSALPPCIGTHLMGLAGVEPSPAAAET